MVAGPELGASGNIVAPLMDPTASQLVDREPSLSPHQWACATLPWEGTDG